MIDESRPPDEHVADPASANSGWLSWILAGIESRDSEKPWERMMSGREVRLDKAGSSLFNAAET